MFRRIQLPLGGWLLLVLSFLGFSAIGLQSSTNLLWHGIAAQGVITNSEAIKCGKYETGNAFSVQFTDQTGQAHTSTISQCTYNDFTASPGDSVTIVYLPNDPTQIAPSNGLPAHIQFDGFMSILLGLITLILLPLWIRKRIRMRSLQAPQDLVELTAEQDQPAQTELTAEQIQQDLVELSAKRDQPEQIGFSADTY
jgi:flagellar biosynthesis/type III secretory pathway M-ring protein FliF/YscJ